LVQLISEKASAFEESEGHHEAAKALVLAVTGVMVIMLVAQEGPARVSLASDIGLRGIVLGIERVKAGQSAVDLVRRIADVRPGTLLGREWNGRMQRVAVRADGFAWNGKTYPSLSQVAFAITGTRWNGPRFFGQPHFVVSFGNEISA
jgi:Protein of unknown function (DUF2924)